MPHKLATQDVPKPTSRYTSRAPVSPHQKRNPALAICSPLIRGKSPISHNVPKAHSTFLQNYLKACSRSLQRRLCAAAVPTGNYSRRQVLGSSVGCCYMGPGKLSTGICERCCGGGDYLGDRRDGYAVLAGVRLLLCIVSLSGGIMLIVTEP